MNEAANSILREYSTNYQVKNAEISRLFAYAKGEADSKCRMFDTPVDYVIELDKYIGSILGQTYTKEVLTKEGIENLHTDKPMLFVSYLSYIGHTAKKWDAAKAKGDAFLAVLEDIELFFQADGTEKAIAGVYPKEVALKVLPIALKENDEKQNKIELNVNINGSTVDLTT